MIQVHTYVVRSGAEHKSKQGYVFAPGDIIMICGKNPTPPSEVRLRHGDSTIGPVGTVIQDSSFQHNWSARFLPGSAMTGHRAREWVIEVRYPESSYRDAYATDVDDDVARRVPPMAPWSSLGSLCLSPARRRVVTARSLGRVVGTIGEIRKLPQWFRLLSGNAKCAWAVLAMFPITFLGLLIVTGLTRMLRGH